MASQETAEELHEHLSGMTREERSDYYQTQVAIRLQRDIEAAKRARQPVPPQKPTAAVRCPNLDYTNSRNGHFMNISPAHTIPELKKYGQLQMSVEPTTTVGDIGTYISSKYKLDPAAVYITYLDRLAPADAQLCQLDSSGHELLSPFLKINSSHIKWIVAPYHLQYPRLVTQAQILAQIEMRERAERKAAMKESGCCVVI